MTTAQMVIGLLFVSLMIFLLTRSPKNLRSSLLLLPTQRQRQIKVISYFLFPIAWLAAVGILTVCSVVVRSSFSQHYPLYRSLYPLVIFFLFLAVYFGLPVLVKIILPRQTSLPAKDDSEQNPEALDRSVARANRAGVISVLLTLVPSGFVCAFFALAGRPGPWWVLTVLFLVMGGVFAWALSRVYRRVIPLPRGGEGDSFESPRRQEKRNWGVFLGGAAVVGLALLSLAYQCLSFNSSYLPLDSRLFMVESAFFCCVIFLVAGLWGGIPLADRRGFILAGFLLFLLNLFMLCRPADSPQSELNTLLCPFFPNGAILLGAFASVIVSAIAGLVGYRRACRQSDETLPSEQTLGPERPERV